MSGLLNEKVFIAAAYSLRFFEIKEIRTLLKELYRGYRKIKTNMFI